MGNKGDVCEVRNGDMRGVGLVVGCGGGGNKERLEVEQMSPEIKRRVWMWDLCVCWGWRLGWRRRRASRADENCRGERIPGWGHGVSGEKGGEDRCCDAEEGCGVNNREWQMDKV